MVNQKTSLKRSISLSLITFYGLGNILGAGIYFVDDANDDLAATTKIHKTWIPGIYVSKREK